MIERFPTSQRNHSLNHPIETEPRQPRRNTSEAERKLYTRMVRETPCLSEGKRDQRYEGIEATSPSSVAVAVVGRSVPLFYAMMSYVCEGMNT